MECLKCWGWREDLHSIDLRRGVDGSSNTIEGMSQWIFKPKGEGVAGVEGQNKGDNDMVAEATFTVVGGVEAHGGGQSRLRCRCLRRWWLVEQTTVVGGQVAKRRGLEGRPNCFHCWVWIGHGSKFKLLKKLYNQKMVSNDNLIIKKATPVEMDRKGDGRRVWDLIYPILVIQGSLDGKLKQSD